MKPGMRHSGYVFAGAEEYCLIAGEANASRRILIVPPLFDEMNRMRRVLVSVMRQLADLGVCSILPDLPGCNESLANLVDQDLDKWRGAVAAAAQQLDATHIASIRGGALIDNLPAELPHWRLCPVKGDSLLKTMLRTRIAGDKEMGIVSNMESLIEQGCREPIELAGNLLCPDMLSSMQYAQAEPLTQLTVAALGDGADDVSGSALWLRAEPQDDPSMAASITKQLYHWSASCGR
jgi:hypothetical protein